MTSIPDPEPTKPQEKRAGLRFTKPYLIQTFKYNDHANNLAVAKIREINESDYLDFIGT